VNGEQLKDPYDKHKRNARTNKRGAGRIGKMKIFIPSLLFYQKKFIIFAA